MNKPKILLLDIETAPILGYVWRLFDQNVGLNQIHQDWYVLAWAAKWLDDPAGSIMYEDQRNAKDMEDDSKMLRKIWNLINEADILITQNGKKFDEKKLNARFLINGMKPPSKCKHIDTCELAKRYFGFTSNKLEYMTNKLNKKYKKLRHAKFDGFELWKECLARNPEAWKEMEKYNKYDVLSLEELYKILAPWDNSINFNLYHDDEKVTNCNCGGKFQKRGFSYTTVGKFQRYVCTSCGSWVKDAKNLFSKEKRNSVYRRIT